MKIIKLQPPWFFLTFILRNLCYSSLIIHTHTSIHTHIQVSMALPRKAAKSFGIFISGKLDGKKFISVFSDVLSVPHVYTF